jgi:hypothetical protein
MAAGGSRRLQMSRTEHEICSLRFLLLAMQAGDYDWSNGA